MTSKKRINTMEDNHQNSTQVNSQMIGSNGKVCEGGIAFRVKNEINVKTLSFSQKRKIGFRNKYEFEKKRVLIADDRKLQIFQYDKQSQHPHIKAQFDVGSDDKKIVFASFFEDSDPKLILIVLYNQDKNQTTFLMLSTIKMRNLDAIAEVDEVQAYINKDLIREIKENLSNNLKDSNQQYSYENLRVKLKNNDMLHIHHRTFNNKGKFESSKREKEIQKLDYSQLNFEDMIKVKVLELSQNPQNNVKQMYPGFSTPHNERRLIKQIVNYGDYVFLIYKETFFVDLFSKNGVCLERFDIQFQFMQSFLQLISIDQLIIQRLDWSDRYFDFVQLNYKQIPNKLLLIGQYQLPDNLTKMHNSSYVMQLNRSNIGQSIIKAFKTNYLITSLQYGPYDNGHILIGMQNGVLLAFDSINMQKLYQIQIFDQLPITNIIIDPISQILISSNQGNEVVAVTFIKTQIDYVYIDLGKRKYCTVLLDKNLNNYSNAGVLGRRSNTVQIPRKVIDSQI
eukprot:403338142